MTGPEQIVKLIHSGNLDEAVRVSRKWTESAPADPVAWQHLGVALAHAGETEQALKALDLGLAVAPEFAELYGERGFALMADGRHEEAAASYQRAMELGDHPVFTNGYGNALLRSGRPMAAARVLGDLVRAHPEFPPAWFNLLQARMQSGDTTGAKELAEELTALAPQDYNVRDAVVWPLLYGDDVTAEELKAAHLAVAQLLPRQRDPRTFPNNRDPERRLRIGFVSPDFREHSVYRFLWPVLEALADHPVDVYAYASSSNQDRGTAHIESLSKKYTDVTPMHPEQFARLVAADKIDILIDLAGHTFLNRLVDISIRLAPIQMSWIGYPYSTGVPAIDFRIVDHLTDPEGSWMTESPLVLNPCFLCFGLPADATEPNDQTSGPTFASFNVLSKLTPTTIGLYAECLKAVPGSQLVLKTLALEEEECRSHLLGKFSAQGVDPARIELLGQLPSYRDHLALYNRVTVALDPYPYHGTTTTCEAYAMGVPVVSLVGQTHQARVGLTLAHAVGHPEWACDTRDAYISAAVRLATSWSEANRQKLRSELKTSSLTDGQDMAERLMTGLRAAWRLWCSRR